MTTTRWGRLAGSYGAVVVMLAWLAVSTRWFSFDESTRVAPDELSYLEIARAAPALPAGPVGSAYAQRFPVHWVIGGLANGIGIDLAVAYRVVSVLVVVGIALLMRDVLGRLGVHARAATIGLAVVLLSPYALRIYLALPAMTADLVFVAATALSLCGLARRRLWIVVIGVLLAVAARQTALLSCVAVAVWLVADRRWPAPPRRRVLAAGAVVVLTVTGFVAVRSVAATFAEPFEPSLPGDSILPLLVPGSGSTGEVVQHLARAASPVLLGVTIALVALVPIRRREHRPVADRRVPLWSATLMSVLIVVQPVLLSPRYGGLAGNEARLAALGLVPLASWSPCSSTPPRSRRRSVPVPSPSWSSASPCSWAR